MKRFHFWLLITACLLFIALTIFTVYISVKTREDVSKQIEYSLAAYRVEDTRITSALVESAVITTVPGAITGEKGVRGLQGVPGNAIVGPSGSPGQNGKDGKDGEKGDPGMPGREIELSKDEQGNILWRYTGDDFWTNL